MSVEENLVKATKKRPNKDRIQSLEVTTELVTSAIEGLALSIKALHKTIQDLKKNVDELSLITISNPGAQKQKIKVLKNRILTDHEGDSNG